MLKSISWTDYIITVSAIFFIYYLYICIRYYWDEIKDFHSVKQKQKQNFMNALDTNRQNNAAIEQIREHGSFENNSDDLNTETEQLTERLKFVIAEAGNRQLIPQEFKQYLSMALMEYPSIRYSPGRSSINELIISECKKYGAAILSEDEVELLWKGGM